MVETKSTQWYWNKVRYAFIFLHMKQGVWQVVHPRQIMPLDRDDLSWSWRRLWWLCEHWSVGGNCSCPPAQALLVVHTGVLGTAPISPAHFPSTMCKQGQGRTDTVCPDTQLGLSTELGRSEGLHWGLEPSRFDIKECIFLRVFGYKIYFNKVT